MERLSTRKALQGTCSVPRVCVMPFLEHLAVSSESNGTLILDHVC